MAYFNFTFTNSNEGQTFIVVDLLDSSRNPIFHAPVNHNATSSSISCWVGDNSKGQVSIQGERGPLVSFDIDSDNQILDY